MSSADENIIKSRLSALSEKQTTITNEVTINGIPYQFCKRNFPLGFSMVLPKSFENLETQYVKLKYPYEDRPSVILSNADTTTNFTFDCIYVGPEETKVRLKKYKNLIKKMHPNYVFFSTHVYELKNGLEIGCYDYRGSALDSDIYYLAFFANLPSNVLLGCFSCPIEQQDLWESLVRQMVQTIKPLPQDEE